MHPTATPRRELPHHASAALRREVEAARSWDELAILCTRIDAEYGRGALDLQTASALGRQAAARARHLPESPPISAASLVDDEERCPCCGASAWWVSFGRTVCGVCHPAPPQEERQRQAA